MITDTKYIEALKLALKALDRSMQTTLHNSLAVDCGKAITAIREALMSVPDGAQSRSDEEQPAQQEQVRVPVTDNTYNYSKSLAEAIFKQHFASDEHYASGRIVWGVNDTVIGILTQIDNMVADMVRRPAPVPKAHEQQKPAARQYQGRDGVWRDFISEKHYKDTLEDGSWPIRDLYASPPPNTNAGKPWVGLTEKEKLALVEYADEAGLDDMKFIEDIEAKLKEKNA